MSVPRTVWVLGGVSLLMDFSSELVHGLLPVFLTTVLGAGMLAVGIVEGVAEATASVLKAFSGALSDRLTRRKPLVVLGYGLSALSKPLFPFAGSVALVLGARFMDRIGKGIREAPRDALIADITSDSLRGRAYGLRQTLDTIGAVLGPLAAVGLMLALANDVRTVLWFAAIPAALCVAMLVLVLDEPVGMRPAPSASPSARNAFRALGGRYWAVVALGGVLTLARFSEAFHILRARELGMALALLPAVLAIMNVVYVAVAYPAGVAADRGHRKALLVWGLLALIASDLVLAVAGFPWFFAGVVLWGVHMGLTQGLLSALVAGAAPAELRGTAFGAFHFVSGAALLAASVIAGALWSAFGAAWTFYAGAGFTAAALVGLLIVTKGR